MVYVALASQSVSPAADMVVAASVVVVVVAASVVATMEAASVVAASVVAVSVVAVVVAMAATVARGNKLDVRQDGQTNKIYPREPARRRACGSDVTPARQRPGVSSFQLVP
uniref:Eyestalk peptide n=1 Tax=Jasus edwardsii TaxID=95461 RepID=Q9NDI7_9EUCA|nr:eyestalk peptide [Jasus edwardsii]